MLASKPSWYLGSHNSSTETGSTRHRFIQPEVKNSMGDRSESLRTFGLSWAISGAHGADTPLDIRKVKLSRVSRLIAVVKSHIFLSLIQLRGL